MVRWDKGDFIGRAALEKQKSEGLKRRLIGFCVEAGGIPRHGARVWANGAEVGVVTSGTFSPTLGYAIGMAYAPADRGAE